MKVTIVSVKYRPWWERLFSVELWRVSIYIEGIGHKTFDCWGGELGDSLILSSLEWSIKNKIRLLSIAGYQFEMKD